MESVFFIGLVLGITSNLHCIGMCGPIALAIPVNRKSNWTVLSGVLQYNFGRIFTYSFLGVIVGSIGITVQTFGFLQLLSIITGVFMIIYAWRKWLSNKMQLPTIGMPVIIRKGLGKVIGSNSLFKLSLLGVLNGFLPCGMVYAALINALLAGNPIGSSGAMLAFGIGTLPSMIAVGFAANRINSSMRHKFNKLVPYMLTVVGLLIVLRGMNLDIPYISPKVSLNKTETSKDEKCEVEMSCCHKSD